MARMTTLLSAWPFPPVMKPPIITFSLVPTNPRVAIFASFDFAF